MAQPDFSKGEAAVDEFLRHSEMPTLAAEYFDLKRRYAAETFSTLAPNEPNVVTATDLFALNLLDVPVGPVVVRWFLDEDRWLTPSGCRDTFAVYEMRRNSPIKLSRIPVATRSAATAEPVLL